MLIIISIHETTRYLSKILHAVNIPCLLVFLFIARIVRWQLACGQSRWPSYHVFLGPQLHVYSLRYGEFLWQIETKSSGHHLHSSSLAPRLSTSSR